MRTQPTLFNRAAIIGCMVVMTTIGLLLSTYGLAIPSFKAQFGISDAVAGGGLAMQSAGAVVGVLAAPFALKPFGNRMTMMVSIVLLGGGGLALAFAFSWPMVLISATIAGLGLGGVDMLITQLLIIGAGVRGPALVNVAHGFFGVGTVISPGILAVIGTERYWIIFAAVGVANAFAFFTMRGLAPRPTPVDAPSAEDTKSPIASRSRWYVGAAVVFGFIVLYVSHFGVQSGIGTWEPTFLADLDFSASAAAWATSGYWFAMVIGRFGAAALTRFISIPTLVVVSCLGMAGSLVWAMTHAPSAVWAFMVCGLFIGPIFPNGLTWLARSGHAHGHRFSYVVAASMVGQAFAPWLIGVVIEHQGSEVMPLTLLLVAVGAVVASIGLAIGLRRRASGASSE
ncbi:MAG: MFS transporter [Gulosibacter sp.]|uniref:MFS transporter n=1 Tax=Gulosibacter sp. TaxID=2817531 RepID=UPI003F907F8A